ncbi:MAG: SDR family oxidoreductase [Anaerolineae bacterium]
MSFTDQVVCITGAGRGLGYAMAERFAAEDAQVVILEKDARTGAASSEQLGATFIELDVSDAAAVARAVAQIDAQFGGIDVWINNAGIAHKGYAVDLSPEDWDADLGVMLSGAFYCANAVGKVFLRQGRGNLINIASVNGLFAQKGRAPYCAAKAGLIMLTKVLASEWGEHGIRVNAIAPGVVMTDLVQQGIDQGLVNEQTYLSRIPMGRLGDKNEVVEVALFLAGNESTFMTGDCVRVDGGWTAYHLFYPFETAF